MKEYWCNLFSDPSFMGALLGALITGMISIVVFKLSKREKSISEKQEFEKIFLEYKENLMFLIKMLSESIKIDEGIYEERDFKSIHMYTKLVRKELEAINLKDVPYKIHEEFAGLKDALRTADVCTNIISDTGSLILLNDELKSSVDKIKGYIEKIDEYVKK